MTPKEKAEELINKYLNASFNCKDCEMPYCDIKCTMLSKREAKVCALITVDYIITETGTKYWYDVKHELEKL
jgi:hypothetical protein